MIRKLTLAVGFSAGYVLGAKAGKERYTQIESKVRELMGQPKVKDFTNNVSSSASAAADKAKSTVNEKVEAVSDKVSSSTPSTTPSTPATPSATPPTGTPDVVVDLGPAGAKTGTAPTTGAAPTPGRTGGLPPRPVPGTGSLGGPIAGASPSSTTPDVL